MTKIKQNSVFRIILITLGACFLYAMNSSIRNNFGIMLQAIMHNANISFTEISFVLAVGQFVFGLVQPFFGIFAAKKGNLFALLWGVILILGSMLLLPYCRSPLSLMLCLGIAFPAGTGAMSFGIIMGSITPKIPVKFVAMVSGIVNASSGIGNTLMSPIINGLIVGGGLSFGMLVLSALSVVMLPVSILLGKGAGTSRKEEQGASVMDKKTESTKAIFKDALGNRTYQYLMWGFLTCGFHMALITNHLPTQFGAYGFSSEAVAYAFSAYGVATIIGSVLSGSLCGKMKIKNVLAGFYGLRPIIVALFLLGPKTIVTITAFTALLGFTGASTVPPVSGLVGKLFGAKNMAMLFGLVFLIHQIGGFLGAWLGGICFETYGAYDFIWIVDIFLCVAAAVISFLIQEKKENGKNKKKA